MKLMELPLWAWIVFYVLVLLMLVADLKMFGKKGQHEVLSYFATTIWKKQTEKLD